LERHTQLFKFPRTPHLQDLGAATRDDLVLTPQEAAEWLRKGVVLGEGAAQTPTPLLVAAGSCMTCTD
jgi:hypothetical protein